MKESPDFSDSVLYSDVTATGDYEAAIAGHKSFNGFLMYLAFITPTLSTQTTNTEKRPMISASPSGCERLIRNMACNVEKCV